MPKAYWSKPPDRRILKDPKPKKCAPKTACHCPLGNYFCGGVHP